MLTGRFGASAGAIGLIGALMAGGSSASAQTPLTLSTRDSSYFITFPSGLDSATTQYDVTTVMPSGGGDYLGSTLNLKTGAYGMFFSTTGTVGTTFTVPPAGTASEVGNITNGGSGGTFKFGYATNNGPDFTTSWTMSTIANGFHVVAFGGVGSQGFGGCGSNFLSVGGTFTCEVEIKGDWTIGNHPGGVYLTNLAAGYSVTTDFAYNGNYTTVAVTSGVGGYNNINPALGLNLVGSAVPEPSTWVMLLLGFSGLGLMYRRTKTRRAAIAGA